MRVEKELIESSRTILGRASKKRPKLPYRHKFERETASTSASTKN